jgi:hypothetical protein
MCAASSRRYGCRITPIEVATIRIEAIYRGAHETAQNDVIGRHVGQGSARTIRAVDDTLAFSFVILAFLLPWAFYQWRKPKLGSED